MQLNVPDVHPPAIPTEPPPSSHNAATDSTDAPQWPTPAETINADAARPQSAPRSGGDDGAPRHHPNKAMRMISRKPSGSARPPRA